MSTTRHTETIEVVTTDQRRRRWSVIEKAELVRRTYVHALKERPASWSDGRRDRKPASDGQLLVELREPSANCLAMATGVRAPWSIALARLRSSPA